MHLRPSGGDPVPTWNLIAACRRSVPVPKGRSTGSLRTGVKVDSEALLLHDPATLVVHAVEPRHSGIVKIVDDHDTVSARSATRDPARLLDDTPLERDGHGEEECVQRRKVDALARPTLSIATRTKGILSSSNSRNWCSRVRLSTGRSRPWSAKTGTEV